MRQKHIAKHTILAKRKLNGVKRLRGERLVKILKQKNIHLKEIRAKLEYSESRRKQLEESRNLILNRFSRAQQIAHLGHWEVNFVTQKTTWSDEAFRIYGMEPGSAEPSKELFFKHVHPDDLDEVRSLMEYGLETLTPFSFYHRIVQSSGNIRSLYSEARFELDEYGKPIGLYGICLDITERKKAVQLEATNKGLEAFSYSVSHDLKAPLRIVSGYAQILKEDYEDKLDDEGKHTIDIIKKTVTKMEMLIDGLLAFSLLGRKNISRHEVDMNKLVEKVTMDVSNSVQHIVKIETGKLHKVEADKDLLYQVMFNLVSNAIKYSSKKDDPVVEIFSKEKNGEVIFSVRDNGVGFDMKYADKLFGVFQRLHTQDKFEGTGVGLAIVHRIITKHGGRVWAKAKENNGAVFSFSLPINP